MLITVTWITGRVTSIRLIPFRKTIRLLKISLEKMEEKFRFFFTIRGHGIQTFNIVTHWILDLEEKWVTAGLKCGNEILFRALVPWVCTELCTGGLNNLIYTPSNANLIEETWLWSEEFSTIGELIVLTKC